MIRCPKCTFEQPADQYCARCGVNMTTYRPPPTPWGRKLAGSSGFYVFLLASVIVSSIYMIFTRSSVPVDVAEPEVAAVAVQNPEPTTTLEETVTAVPRGGIQVAVTPSNDDSALAQKFKTAAENLFKKNDDSPATTTAANTWAAPRARNKVKVAVRFLEVPQNNIGTLFAGSGDSATGVVSDFSTHLTDARRQSEGKLKTLSSSEKTIEALNTPLRFDEILNESTGLYIRVLPISMNESVVNLDVHIEYRSPNATGASTMQEYDGSFSVPNAAAAYFADVMPRNPVIRPEDSELYSRSPVFKILTSPTYLTNSTEFLIFFEVTGLAE